MQFQLFIFDMPACLQKKGFTDDYYYFRRTGTIWADRVSLRMNTIASRDQIKPMRIGDNLQVNYNLCI